MTDRERCEKRGRHEWRLLGRGVYICDRCKTIMEQRKDNA
jgi:hypothetical protein